MFLSISRGISDRSDKPGELEENEKEESQDIFGRSSKVRPPLCRSCHSRETIDTSSSSYRRDCRLDEDEAEAVKTLPTLRWRPVVAVRRAALAQSYIWTKFSTEISVVIFVQTQLESIAAGSHRNTSLLP